MNKYKVGVKIGEKLKEFTISADYYYINEKIVYFVVKEEKEEIIKRVFGGTKVNKTTNHKKVAVFTGVWYIIKV